MQERNGSWLVLIAAMLWGTTGTAQAFAPPTVSPLGVGVLRLLIGGLALLVVAVWLGNFSMSALQALSWKHVLASAVAMALYQPLFFAGVRQTGVAIGTVVAIGSAPLISGVLPWLWLGKRPSARWAVATVLAIGGCALLSLPEGTQTFRLTGLFLAIGAGASYACYVLASKPVLEKAPPSLVTGLTFALAAVLLSPLLAVVPMGWLAELRGWLVVLHLGLLATALAYSLFGSGLRHTPVSTAVTLSLLEPVTATLLGVFLLRENLALTGWAGIVLVFIGILWLITGKI